MDTGKKIDAEAAYWVVRLDSGDMSTAEKARLQQWLAADRRHPGAYLRAQAVYASAGQLAALRPAATGSDAGHKWQRRWLPRILWAAGIAVLISGVLALFPDSSRGRWYRAPPGAVLNVALPDGSVAVLNSDTLLWVEYGRDMRQLRLQRGEVLVNVLRDQRRPFRVRAGSTDVVALGTSFSVRRVDEERVAVLVREGVVEVRETARRRPPLQASANHAVTTGSDQAAAVEVLSRKRVEQRLAWREGMLAFEGTTLAEALAEFARYSEARIVLPEPEVAARRIAGLYAANDVLGFAKAVAIAHDLSLQQTGENSYELRQKPAASSATTSMQYQHPSGDGE